MRTIRKKQVWFRFICVYLCSSVVGLLFISGCSSPNTANIELRKDIQSLHGQIDDLNRRHEADAATIEGMKKGTTAPALSEDRLSQLFTVHGLKFGRLTGGADLDPAKPGDEALKVYVVPTDDAGQPLKAAGSFQIDAFDLALGKDAQIGKWSFDVGQTRDAWLGEALLYTYVLTCPMAGPPAHADVTVRVTFTDLLTGRLFVQQRQVNVRLPKS